jgi:hypothetical protein
VLGRLGKHGEGKVCCGGGNGDGSVQWRVAGARKKKEGGGFIGTTE